MNLQITIDVPDNLYNRLAEAALANGVTPTKAGVVRYHLMQRAIELPPARTRAKPETLEGDGNGN